MTGRFACLFLSLDSGGGGQRSRLGPDVLPQSLTTCQQSQQEVSISPAIHRFGSLGIAKINSLP
jgi:hypothetical protein